MKQSIKNALIQAYEAIYPYLRRLKFDLRYRFRVMTAEQTIAYIQKNRCSIARYGDGEFGLIHRSNNPDFQTHNDALAARLAQVCVCRDPRLLVCVPHSFKTLSDCNEFAYKFWNWWLWANDNLVRCAQILELKPFRTRVFGDAQITRPYMDWKDKQNAGKRFDLLKSLWQGRDVLIVEGEETRLGVGNDLLSGAASVRRILCPAKNAFDVYDEIEACVLAHAEKESLVLLALGPTATVLAHDLAMKDVQALDIGHIDIEYEWYRTGATTKTVVAGKATQEAHASGEDVLAADPVYRTQIVARVGC